MSKLTQNQWIGVTVALIIVFLFFTFGQFFYSFFSQEIKMTDKKQTASVGNIVNNPQNLVVNDIVVGTGAEAVSGKTVTVHYVGTLNNGQKFDSSVDRGEPFHFTLGIGQVIKGWDLGVSGMKVGGKRHLVIPAQLGYGSQEIPGVIPANSTLVFDVELLDVK